MRFSFFKINMLKSLMSESGNRFRAEGCFWSDLGSASDTHGVGSTPSHFYNDNQLQPLYPSFVEMPVCDLFGEKECVKIEGNPLREALAKGLKSCGDARGINLQVNTWQVDVAATFLEGYNQMLVTATGTGKTLCFLMGLLSRQDKSVLVVSPLLSLMANQVSTASKCLPMVGEANAIARLRLVIV